MEESGDHKRPRSDEGWPEISSPEAKRLRDNLFLDDNTDDDAGRAGEQDVASVMKSLEDEIAVPSSPPLRAIDSVVDMPDLGYLFEATDDELGLPPAAALSTSDESWEATEEDVAADPAVGEVEGLGLGQMWGFGDEIYDGVEGFGVEERAVTDAPEDGVVFDVGLFDFADVVFSGPSDLADVSWRSGTLPAN